jgi:C1A family cysteine protease
MKTQMLAILAIFALTLTNALEIPTFDQFLTRFDKQYDNKEYHERKVIFHENLRHIMEHNDSNFSLGINRFTDLLPSELPKGFVRTNTLGYGLDLTKTNGCNKFNIDYSSVDSLPESVDWRKNNAVTSVKNQGQCGSCWSFSAAGAMEGAWAIASGDLINLSEQQLMDCSIKYGNLVCNGGLMDNAFDYAIDNGMCSYDDDPYEAQKTTCPNCQKVAFFSSCVDVTPSNEQDLMAAVAQQPVSVAIEADTAVFQLYNGGILDSPKCGTNLDHGVLVVGYGTDNGVDYWTVKNSWGESWGEDGYIRIKRTVSDNSDGICGIAMQPSFPVAKV